MNYSSSVHLSSWYVTVRQISSARDLGGEIKNRGDMTGQHFQAVLPDFILPLRDWNQLKYHRDFHHVNVLARQKYNLHLEVYGPLKLKRIKKLCGKIGFYY